MSQSYLVAMLNSRLNKFEQRERVLKQEIADNPTPDKELELRRVQQAISRLVREIEYNS